VPRTALHVGAQVFQLGVELIAELATDTCEGVLRVRSSILVVVFRWIVVDEAAEVLRTELGVLPGVQNEAVPGHVHRLDHLKSLLVGTSQGERCQPLQEGVNPLPNGFLREVGMLPPDRGHDQVNGDIPLHGLVKSESCVHAKFLSNGLMETHTQNCTEIYECKAGCIKISTLI
jgi:hypothetical protein